MIRPYHEGYQAGKYGASDLDNPCRHYITRLLWGIGWCDGALARLKIIYPRKSYE